MIVDKFATHTYKYILICNTVRLSGLLFTKRNIDKLERIQRRATKFILKSNDQYDIRLRELKFLTLEQRRFLFDVTFLFTALNGYMDVIFSQFLDFYCQGDHYSFRHFDNRSLN